MLVTVTLVSCLLGSVAAQDSALGKTAYVQLMVGCLGETSYKEYLDSVAAAGRECGAGVGVQGFFPGLASLLHSPSLAHFPQGIPFSQSGSVVLQRPLGVLGSSRVTPQHPGILPQQLGVFGAQPGITLGQPGILAGQPGIIAGQPGILSGQPGILSGQPGILSGQPGILSGQPGILAQQPGTFPQESGIFSSLLDSQSRVTPVGITDSVPPISSPVGPSYPGIRQKRQVSLNLADIQRTRENMRALVNNFTCILTKLAVVNANLDLNHSGLSNSVINLPVARELKQDLLNAINYCTDTTRCLPLEKQQLPIPHKLKRVMEYIKCEKEMRLKACHKNNIRQRVQNISLGHLPHDGSQFNGVEEIVTLLVDAQSVHELELI
ncbi:uncharacterized protein LOC123519817 [Portunus trituberculatus]|uniref:uncharacterized protein LOC123519817 n=1 Tax=Portunus trituberculatus TaxID=210409 RepID=UPI001E1D141E|nr:uncharacterized protein LOC123519817 [Portunus trituberculatus]